MQSEVDGKQSMLEKYMSEFQHLKEQTTAADSRKNELICLRTQFGEELRKAESVPQKAVRQVQVVQTLNTQLEAQHKRISDELKLAEANYVSAQEQIQGLEAEHATTMVEVERAQYASEAQERSADQVQKQSHMKHFEAEQILGQQVALFESAPLPCELIQAKVSLTACCISTFVHPCRQSWRFFYVFDKVSSQAAVVS